jgi:hypothetical protein
MFVGHGQQRLTDTTAGTTTRHLLGPYITAGVAVVGASLVAVTPVAPPAYDVQVRAVLLTGSDSADSPLGDGTALIVGPSGIPIPSQKYVDSFDQLYLEPRDFTGTAQPLFTPEGFYPVTGVKSLTVDASEAQGLKILDSAIQHQIAGGGVNAENPVVVGGYSQSSQISALLMPQLADQGVPSDDVHFVLLGDPSAPNGGLVERFDVPAGSNPSIPSLGITFTGAEQSDLYPTDVYSLEYDGFADFPQYPIDFLSDLNALLGIFFEHLGYLGLTPEQINDATQLPTSAADTLTNYYMIPADSLPLLDPLLLLPLGKPLYDLLEPDISVLVNLGYGSITEGWSPGDADVPTTFGLFPPLSVLEQVPQALATGLQKGITDAITDLQNPDTYQYSMQTILDQPFLKLIIDAANAAGFLDTTSPSLLQILQAFTSLLGSSAPAEAGSSLTDVINDLTSIVSTAYAQLLPIADTEVALGVTLPLYDANIFINQLEHGNLLDAIGLPFAANTALEPFAVVLGEVEPIAAALGSIILDLTSLTPEPGI